MAANDTLFFHGDSKVAIDNPRSYHDIFCSAVGLNDRYWGSFGRTMQRLSTNYPVNNSVQYILENGLVATLDIPSDGIYYYDARVKNYYMCFGTNDVIQIADSTNTIENFKSWYRAYINRLLQLEWPKEKLNIINLDIIDFGKQPGNLSRLQSYNAAILAIASEFGIRHFDVYTNQMAQSNPIATLLSSDGLHLSLLGNQVNAAYLQAHMNDPVGPPDPSDDYKTIYGWVFTKQSSTPGDTWRTAFTHAYKAPFALDRSGGSISDGEEVGSFADQIGAINMTYAGAPHPILSDAYPRYKNILNGLVFFPNEPNVRYQSASLGSDKFPWERWFIGLPTNSLIFEAFFNADEYLGDLGFGGLRTRSNSDWAGDNSYKSNLGLSPNKPFLIRQQFINEVPDIPEAGSADRTFLIKSRMWVNGIEVNHILPTNKINPRRMTVGVDTNNSYFGFMALYHKDGTIPDLLASQLTSELMTEFKIDQPINLPYAESVNIDVNSRQITGSFSYHSAGLPENPSARIIRWILLVAGPTVSNYMPELDGLLTFNTADYPQYTFTPGVTALRLEVTCFDTDGKHTIPQTAIKSL